MKSVPVPSAISNEISVQCVPRRHLLRKHILLRYTLHAGAAVLLPLALASTAFAQQLLQPAVAPVTQPAPPAGTGPRLTQPADSTTDTVRSTPEARPSAAAIRATGPAKEAPAFTLRKLPPASQWAPVLNASGVPVEGYLQVAPNRVYDPARNLYHWTVPAGDQQKIVQ